MADIFLSYANEDRETAAALARSWSRRLDRVVGSEDTSQPDLAFCSRRRLNDARCLVVLWSRHSVTIDWVKEEAEEARRRGW